MTNPLRIIHLPSSYLPESVGGTEIYVDRLCRALEPLGVESAVALHALPQSDDARFPYEIFRLPICSSNRAELYARSTGGEPPEFRKLLEAWQPDIVHLHAITLGAGPDHARVAAQMGIPYVLTYHTPAMSCPRGTMLHLGAEPCDGAMHANRCSTCVLQSRGWPLAFAALGAMSPLGSTLLPEGPWTPRLALPSLLDGQFRRTRELLDGAAQIVACANWCADVLAENGVSRNRITVLRQAVDGPTRSRRIRLPLDKSRQIRLGCLGRICKIKGPDVLLAALPLLVERGLDAVCEFVGPVQSDESKWFESILQAQKKHARHLGTLRGASLQDWLSNLDLLVVPSRWLETGPLTLLEAWDLGVPVVGADRGGIRDFMDDADMAALKFTPESPASLADAVLHAVEWKDDAPEVEVRGFEQLAGEMMTVYAASVAKSRCEAAA